MTDALVKEKAEVSGPMAEVVRFFARRLREFVINRRSARRYRVSLPVTVELISDAYSRMYESKGGNGKSHTTLSGHTRDISETGIGFIAPSIHIDGRYLTDQDRVLLITLELPEATIQMRAVAKRHQPLEMEQNERGFLIGAEIKEMSREDEEYFSAYLKELQG